MSSSSPSHTYYHIMRTKIFNGILILNNDLHWCTSNEPKIFLIYIFSQTNELTTQISKVSVHYQTRVESIL